MRSQGVPGKMGVLIPSVMALRETAMTAPLDQQGEPLRPDREPLPIGRGKTLIRHGYAVPPSPKGRLWRTDCDRRESLEEAAPVRGLLTITCVVRQPPE